MKFREFYIRYGSSSNGGPFPEPVVYKEDPKINNGFGGITLHVREVSPELDLAIQKMVEALEAVSNEDTGTGGYLEDLASEALYTYLQIKEGEE